jgi:hypothetical protein
MRYSDLAAPALYTADRQSKLIRGQQYESVERQGIRENLTVAQT